MLEGLLILLLGWALGLASPLIVDGVRRHFATRKIRAALRIELQELRYRLGTVVYLIRVRLGTFDKPTLEWIQSILTSYKGLNPAKEILAAVEKLLTLPEAQINQLAQMEKAQAGRTLSLKKYHAPFLESQLQALSSLDPNIQNRLLEIRVQLFVFNELVEEPRYYKSLTFNSGLSEENYNLAVENLLSCQETAASTAKIIADHIGEIRW